MKPEVRARWKRSRFRRVPRVVFTVGFSLVAAAGIRAYAAGDITLDAFREGRVPAMTVLGLVGGLIVTGLLALMVRALGIAGEEAAVGEAEARALLELQARRFHALEKEGWDGVMIVDILGTLQWMGVTAARILHLDPHDVLGSSLLTYVHAPDVDEFLASLAVAKGAAPKVFEFRMKDSTGRLHWLEAITSDHVDDEALAGIILHFRETTERRTLELTLRDQNQEMRAAFEDSMFGAAVVATDGELLSMNEALATTMQRDIATLTGRPIGALLSPRDRSAVRASMKKMLRSEEDRLHRYVQLAHGAGAAIALTPVVNEASEVRSFLLQVVELPSLELPFEPQADASSVDTDDPFVELDEELDHEAFADDDDALEFDAYEDDDVEPVRPHGWSETVVDFDIFGPPDLGDESEEPRELVALAAAPELRALDTEPLVVTKEIEPTSVLRRMVIARLHDNAARAVEPDNALRAVEHD